MEIPIAGKTVFILRRGPDLVVKGMPLVKRNTILHWYVLLYFVYVSVDDANLLVIDELYLYKSHQYITKSKPCALFFPLRGRVTHRGLRVHKRGHHWFRWWPLRRQAIIWTNVGLLWIGLWGTNFSEIGIKIRRYLFKKIHLKMSSAKFRLGLHALSVHVCFCMPLFYDPS